MISLTRAVQILMADSQMWRRKNSPVKMIKEMKERIPPVRIRRDRIKKEISTLIGFGGATRGPRGGG